MSPEAGWYDDGSGRQRWWDGAQWTEHFAPAADASEAAAHETAASETAGAASLPQPMVVAPGAPEQSFGTPAHSAFVPPSTAVPGASPYETAASDPAAKKKPSVIGWIALAVSVLGFIFACIPGALIVGWVLLPIGFILSIIAFFIKGAKWPAITGVAVSVVGVIVGVIVFFSLFVSAAQDAFGGTDSSISQPSTGDSEDEGEQTDEGDDSEEAAASADGTRENPAPLGSVISGDEYDVVINSVTLNATDEVMAANMFNEEPEAGFAYAIINVSVTYTGAESGFAAMAMIDYVTAGGEVISSLEGMAVAPDPALGFDELYTDATATGNIALAIPVDDDGLLRVKPGVLADEVFVELQ